MKIIYIVLFFMISQWDIAASQIERSNKKRLEKYSEQYSKAHQKKSQLARKKRRIDRKVQYLRNKIDDEEADSAEQAKFYDLLQKQKQLSEKIEALS
jgi:hypothetical protein